MSELTFQVDHETQAECACLELSQRYPNAKLSFTCPTHGHIVYDGRDNLKKPMVYQQVTEPSLPLRPPTPLFNLGLAPPDILNQQESK